MDYMRKYNLAALIAIGGDDTLGAAGRLHADVQLNVNGVPKTIDNDLSITDKSFGFDTSVARAAEITGRARNEAYASEAVVFTEY